MGMRGQFHSPASLPPGKESMVPIKQDAVLAAEPLSTSWRQEKYIIPTEHGIVLPQLSTPWPSHCTKYIILAPHETDGVYIHARQLCNLQEVFQ